MKISIENGTGYYQFNSRNDTRPAPQHNVYMAALQSAVRLPIEKECKKSV